METDSKSVKEIKVSKQPNGNLFCQLCKEEFYGMNDVVKHIPNCAKLNSAKEIKKTDVITNWNCSACNLSFDDQKDLDKHYRNPSCKKAVQCSSCTIKFKNLNRFLVHKESCDKVKEIMFPNFEEEENANFDTGSVMANWFFKLALRYRNMQVVFFGRWF